MEAIEKRFLRYVHMNTASDEASKTCPSTPGQRVLAEQLCRELKEMGIPDARVSEFGYVYASLPATPGRENDKAVGLIAHMDTVNGVPVEPIRERMFTYTGGDIVLNAEKDIRIPKSDFPFLKDLTGDELIVTDGTTLLGADDKAGVALIMALCEMLTQDPSIPHGKICVGFTPDEEIGRGADKFDVPGFGADYAYTLDGGDIRHPEYENFNAATAVVTIQGRSIHPGSAKGKMINASKVAMEFQAMLPVFEAPEYTEMYEGFAHLVRIDGTDDHCKMVYILRDHDADKLAQRKDRFVKTAAFLCEKYMCPVAAVALRDGYRNMAPEIRKVPYVTERAEKALALNGITPVPVPIRGGTDGATLTFMGLPCPNLGTGGGNYHGVYEFLSVTQMRKMLEVLRTLVSMEA